MIRKYRAGDAFKVRVQPEQQAEAVTWAAEFERIPAFALVEKGNDGSAAGEKSGNMGAAEYDASGNGGAAAGDGKPAGRQWDGNGGRVLAVFGFRIEGGDITTGREAECFALVGIES